MSDFDLDEYLGPYTGHTYIARLIFIAGKDENLSTPALMKAAAAIKASTKNTKQYKEVMEKLGDASMDGPDTTWIADTDKQAEATQSSLELQLNHELTNQNHAAAREVSNRIGDFYYSRGEHDTALKYYLKARDLNPQNEDMVQMCMNVVKTTLEMGKFNHVLSYVGKAENHRPDPEQLSHLSCAAGLALLDRGSYSGAASKFLAVSSVDPSVMSMKDVVTYAGLCALATFSRSEMKSRVVDNKKFRERLEEVPAVREMILDSYSSSYSSCLQSLDNLEGTLSYDIHVHDHIKTLKTKIRKKAILQYFSPFAAVSLETMAQSFNSDVATIEKECAALIMDNQLDGKIDSHNKILYASEGEKRRTAFRSALRLAESYEQSSHALLVRVNLLNSGSFVKPARFQMAGAGVGGGGGIGGNALQQMLQMMGGFGGL